MSAIPLERDIHYPESDGRPMAETDLHLDVMFDLIHALKTRYRDHPDVYVGGNLLLYYVKGDPRFSISPDVLVTKGIGKGRRDTYLLWVEGRPPCFVIEVTSKSTRNEDLEKKKSLYERLGVDEYFLFDPREEYLHPRLQGHRLAQGRYQPIPSEPDGSLLSRTTGLLLKPEGENLRLIDAATGERLRWTQEETEAREKAERAQQAAEAQVKALEEEIARLRREASGSSE
jgi:Uma2 family endonuclease